MRSLPSVLRSLTQAPLRMPPGGGGALDPGAPASGRGGSFASTGVALRRPTAEERALHQVELERVESLLRRYQGRPAVIENPFAAFPTRTFWLGRLMDHQP